MKEVFNEVYKGAIDRLESKIKLMEQIVISEEPKELAKKKINQFKSRIKLLERKIDE